MIIKSLHQILEEPNRRIELLDVRSNTEFGICHLSKSRSKQSSFYWCLSTNVFVYVQDVPLSELLADPSTHLPRESSSTVVVVCRLGNDSQLAAQALRSISADNDAQSVEIYDLIGGLRSWSKEVDKEFPVY